MVNVIAPPHVSSPSGRPPVVRRRKGWMSDLLPSVLVDDPADNFAFRRFVSLFEEQWETTLQRIDDLEYQLDPRTSSPAFQQWLAGWVGFKPGNWIGPVEETAQAERLREAQSGSMNWVYSRLVSRHGTEAWYSEMLAQMLKAATGDGRPARIQIDDPSNVVVLPDPPVKSESSTSTDQPVDEMEAIRVIVTAPASSHQSIRDFFALEMPVGVTFELTLVSDTSEEVS